MMPDKKTIPLRFQLERKVKGPPGADDAYYIAADGVQFADGTVVIRWRGEHASTQTYSDWGHAMRIHHIGEPGIGADKWTTAQWLDGECFCCGADLWKHGAMFGGNGAQCLCCSSGWQGPPSRFKDEHKGTWRGFELPAKKATEGQ